jgi:hypothetical protein
MSKCTIIIISAIGLIILGAGTMMLLDLYRYSALSPSQGTATTTQAIGIITATSPLTTALTAGMTQQQMGEYICSPYIHRLSL